MPGLFDHLIPAENEQQNGRFDHLIPKSPPTSVEAVDTAIEESFTRLEDPKIPDFKTRGQLYDFARHLPRDDPRFPEIEKRVQANLADEPFLLSAFRKLGLKSTPLKESNGFAKAMDSFDEYQAISTEQINKALRDSGPGQVMTELAANTSSSLAKMGDALIIGPINEIRNIGNGLRQATGKDPVELLDSFESAANELGADQHYMKPGLFRDVVATTGQALPLAAGIGSGIRTIGQKIRPSTTMAPTNLAENVIREFGTTTTAADLGYGALAATGSATGRAADENLGGSGNIGELVGGLVFPAGAAMAKQAMPSLASAAPAQPRASETAHKVDLYPGQRSLDPEMLRAQQFLPELSPTAQLASNKLSKQNRQVSDAVDNFLAYIGPENAVIGANERTRAAAKKAISNAIEARKAKTSPLYEEAFEESSLFGGDVDLKPVKEAIDSFKDNYPESGTVVRALNKIDDLLETGATLRKLHGAKEEIDIMLGATGENSLGRTTKKVVRDVKEILLDQMSISSKKYDEARQLFQAESPPIDKLKNSVVGKVADLTDTQVQSISKSIFDPAQTDKTSIKYAKKIISDVDGEVWDRLLRAEVERRITSIKPELGASFENLPSKLANAMFGNAKKSEALLAAMSPQQRANAELLQDVLVRAGLGRPGGSPTAGRTQFIKDLDTKGIGPTIRKFFRNPVDKVISTGENTAFEKRAKALAEVIFDPAWSGPANKALRQNNGQSFGYLLYQALETNNDDEE